MQPLRVALIVAIAVTAMVQAGCDHGPRIGPADKITKVGDNQSASVGSPVAIAPAIVVLDVDGHPVPGIPVTFAVVSGGGTIDSIPSATDKTGTARVRSWTLGTGVGTNALAVFAGGVPGSPVQFTASGVASPPATITRVGTDPITAAAGGSIDSIVVRVADEFGNPVAGQTVSFAITAGGGSVSPPSRVTLADGMAGTRWTLGPTLGETNSMTASVGNLSISFSTLAGRPIGSIQISPRVLVVDSTGSITPTIVAFESNGATVPGASTSLAVRNPTVASPGATSITGLRTGQTFVVATSNDNLTVRDSALLLVGNVGGPVVTLDVPRFDLKADTTFTVSLVADMRSPQLLGAATLQVTWDPDLLTLVSEQAGTANVFATSNTSAISTGSLTLAVASGNGVGGAVEVRRLTFKSGTTVGKTGLLAVNVIDLTAAETFSNLVLKTVSGSYPMRIR